MKESKRLDYLDLMRGILILYVVFVHMSLTNGYIAHGNHKGHIAFDIFSFFMVPFFINSGYFFRSGVDKAKAQNVKEKYLLIKAYVIRKVKKLLYPYTFWFVVSLVVYYTYRIVIQHTWDIDYYYPIQPLIYTMGSGGNAPLWFLWSLFCITVIYFSADLFLNSIQLNLFIAFAFLFSYAVQITQIQFFGCGNICLGLFYYHIGRLIQGKIVGYLKFRLFLVAILVFAAINVLHPQYMAFVTLTLTEGDYFTNVLFSLTGTFLLWYICFKIRSVKWLNAIGVNSLVLYVSHRIILNWIYDPLITMYGSISYPLYIALGFCVILSVFWLLNSLLQRYLPFAVGH